MVFGGGTAGSWGAFEERIRVGLELRSSRTGVDEIGAVGADGTLVGVLAAGPCWLVGVVARAVGTEGLEGADPFEGAEMLVPDGVPVVRSGELIARVGSRCPAPLSARARCCSTIV